MKHKIKSLLWLTFALVWISILGGIFAISMGWIGYLPPIEQLQNPIDKYASQVLAADGEVIGSYAHGGSNRVLVDYKDLSPNLVKALIATEDVRFEGHSGIDFRSLARAIFKTGILQQKSAGGGSTITQQLAKMLYSPPSSNIFTRMMKKPVEWVIAAKLERYYTKEEILAMYLNLQANNMLPMAVFGMLSYLEPILLFVIAVLWLDEPLENSALAGYGLIWLGLSVMIANSLIRMKKK